MTCEQFNFLYLLFCRCPSFRDALAKSDPQLFHRFDRCGRYTIIEETTHAIHS